MQHRDNMQTAASLKEQTKALWEKLEVDKAERETFLAKHIGIKKSVLNAVSILKLKL